MYFGWFSCLGWVLGFGYVVIWLCFRLFGFDLLVCGFIVLGSIRSVCVVMVEILVFGCFG